MSFLQRRKVCNKMKTLLTILRKSLLPLVPPIVENAQPCKTAKINAYKNMKNQVKIFILPDDVAVYIPVYYVHSPRRLGHRETCIGSHLEV